jgi:hypothetical protein
MKMEWSGGDIVNMQINQLFSTSGLCHKLGSVNMETNQIRKSKLIGILIY